LFHRKHGAEIVFIGTRTGLTRLLSLSDMKVERYVKQHYHQYMHIEHAGF